MRSSPRVPLPFTTLDPIDETSRAGILFQYLEPSGSPDFLPAPCADCVVRVVASGRYVEPSTGLGGYASLGVAYSKEPHEATALGNLELGGIYAPWFAPIVLHLGVTLPTADAGYEERTIAFAETAALLRDHVDAIPDATALRIGLSTHYQYRYFFAQADAGVDWVSHSADFTTYGAAFHMDLGIGITDDTSSLTVELASLSYLEGSTDFGPSMPAATLDTLAVAGRLRWRTLEPFFAVIAPLDEDARGQFKLAIIAGVDVPLR